MSSENTETTIGMRVGRRRRAIGMTQEQLSDASGVSTGAIRKLESGERTGARLSTVAKLARPLGVPTTALVGDTSEATVKREVGDDDEMGLIELRRVLTPARGLGGLTLFDELEGPITLASVTSSVRYADELYHHDEYAALLRALPGLLTETRHLVGDVTGDDQAAAYGLQALAYRLAGKALLQLRRLDLSHIALAASLEAAGKSATPDRAGASVIRTMCWLLTRQGRFADAEALAVRTAAAIEPRFSTVSPLDLANWGWLLLYASGAAARDARPDDAREQLNLAEAGAVRLGELPPAEWDDVEMGGFSVAKVRMMRTEAAVVGGEPGEALRVAATVEPSSVPTPSCQHRHQLDVASANLSLKTTAGNARAGEVLMGLGRTAPTWLRNQRYAGDLVTTLAGRRKRAATDDLAQLTALVGVDQ